jgi:hypothetical protein
MEVALSLGCLRLILAFRAIAIEPEREDAVPVAGALVEGGYIAI